MRIIGKFNVKILALPLTIIFLSLLSSPSWSETVTMDDLVQRGGLYYEKFMDVPFTGEVSGEVTGKIKDGTKEGYWRKYYDNGQLRSKGNFLKGTEDGPWEGYHRNGELWYKGYYKQGKADGFWEQYFDNGGKMNAGYYSNGKLHGIMKIFDRETGNGTLVAIEVYNHGLLVKRDP